MSVYVNICPKCRKKVAVPRPGSLPDQGDDIKSECPFCQAVVGSVGGFDVAEPAEAKEDFDLLGVS